MDVDAAAIASPDGDETAGDLPRSAVRSQVPLYKTALPENMALPEPIASYEPPRADDSEDEDINKAWLNRRRTKGRVVLVNNDKPAEGAEEDDRIYCICQTKYDADVSVLIRARYLFSANDTSRAARHDCV